MKAWDEFRETLPAMVKGGVLVAAAKDGCGLYLDDHYGTGGKEYYIRFTDGRIDGWTDYWKGYPEPPPEGGRWSWDPETRIPEYQRYQLAAEAREREAQESR